jgi:hypothetical protein
MRNNMSSPLSSAMPKVRLTECPTEETKKIGHIYINGQRYRVSVIGTNVKNFSSSDETLIKAHMIAATKLKGDKDVTRIEVTKNTTKITKENELSPTIQKNNDEKILDNKTLANGAAIETTSYKKELKESDFQQVKEKIGTTLTVESVFSSLVRSQSSSESDRLSTTTYETARGRLDTIDEEDEDSYETPKGRMETSSASLTKREKTQTLRKEERARTLSEESADSIERNGVELDEDVESPLAAPLLRSSKPVSQTAAKSASSIRTPNLETQVPPSFPVLERRETSRESSPKAEQPASPVPVKPTPSRTRAKDPSFLPKGSEIEMTNFNPSISRLSLFVTDSSTPIIDRIEIERSSSEGSSPSMTSSTLDEENEYCIYPLYHEDDLENISGKYLEDTVLPSITQFPDLKNLDSIESTIDNFDFATAAFRKYADLLEESDQSGSESSHLIADYCTEMRFFFSQVLRAEKRFKDREERRDDQAFCIQLIHAENEAIELALELAKRSADRMDEIKCSITETEHPILSLLDSHLESLKPIYQGYMEALNQNKRFLDGLSREIIDESTDTLPDAREILADVDFEVTEEDAVGLLFERSDSGSITESQSSYTTDQTDSLHFEESSLNPDLGRADLRRVDLFH